MHQGRSGGEPRQLLDILPPAGRRRPLLSERQSDMLVSTLASYLRALGVDAKIVVEVGERR